MVTVLVGRVIRYQADKSSKFLYDKAGRYNPDPDFISNPIPVWAICGPEIRKELLPGDVLFFTPKKANQPREWIESGRPYRCTGYMTGRKKEDRETVLKDLKLKLKFKRRYKRDLVRHQTKSTECCKRTDRIAKLFPQNFIYGYSVRSGRSKWLGRNGPSLVVLLKQCGMNRLAKQIQTGIYNPRLRKIPDKKVPQLLRLLKK